MSLVWFLTILLTLSLISGQTQPPRPPSPRGYLINCGSKTDIQHNNITYSKDTTFIITGTTTTLNQTNLVPFLTTLRYFPYGPAKHCYEFPVIKGAKFLIRTTYFYGGFDGGNEPPVFDQIIDGTIWSVVNTTEDYKNGLTSYYEIIVVANSKTISVCFASNEHTKENGTSFVSLLEVMNVDLSLYNSTDFGKYGLVTVARSNFASDGDIIRYEILINKLHQNVTFYIFLVIKCKN